jgi:hypothetical protein
LVSLSVSFRSSFKRSDRSISKLLFCATSRAKAGTSVSGNNILGSGDTSDAEDVITKPKAGFSSFVSLGLMENSGAADQAEEEEEDFGGLMVRFITAKAFVVEY